MKRLILIFAGAVLVIGAMGVLPGLFQKWKGPAPALSFEGLKDGDLIFHSSQSAQAMAIQLITHSPYTHCGLLFKEAGRWMVLEAVQPVRITALKEWISRGKEQRFVVKRLRDESSLRPKSVRDCMLETGRNWTGRNYDLVFAWSDKELYCSELIYKLYLQCAGVRLGRLQTLGSLDLSAPQVQELMYQRFGNSVPLADTVITPVSIFRAPELRTIIADGRYIR